MQVWDRKELVEVPEVGIGAIRFVYGTVLGRLLAKGILCRKFVSDLYGLWQKSPLSRSKVKKFMEEYNISVEDCTEQDFPNFNAFFTRQRKAVEDHTDPHELPAIADSKLSALPIDRNSRFTVKGVEYTLPELLEDEILAKRYEGGLCLIFRLAPEDYHRYAFPDRGTAEDTHEIRGVLHTVNPIAGSMGVYRRNSRHYTVLHTEHFGEMIQMEVGALLVGKICNHGHRSFRKLEEKGYFAYGGSTVILLCRKDRVKIDGDILDYSAKGIETKVHLGERIGEAL
jgi:phosphatidylserine decarboxylase